MRLNEIRKALGFSVAEVADALDLSYTTLGMYFSGEMKLKSSQESRIANFFALQLYKMYS